MAESIKRLTGPELITGTIASPQTLTTVPLKKTYVIRDVTIVGSPTVGPSSSGTPTFFLGLTNLNDENLVLGQTLESTAGGYFLETASMAIPFTEGEVLVTGIAGLPYITSLMYGPSGSGITFTENNVDATSFSGLAGTPPNCNRCAH